MHRQKKFKTALALVLEGDVMTKQESIRGWLGVLLFAWLPLSCSGADEPDSPVGRNCTADSECGPEGHCVGDPKGICSVPAEGACTNGSREQCPDDSICWKTNGGEHYCWADCNVTCGSNGECDEDDLCVPIEPKGTHCECSCSCRSCSATAEVTCGVPSTQCGSCEDVCYDTCTRDGLCGGYVSGSGTCT
jgi:hypothetical protein